MWRGCCADAGIWIVRLDPQLDEAAEQIRNPDQPNAGGHCEQRPGESLGHLVGYNVGEGRLGAFLRRFTQSLPTRSRFVAAALADQSEPVAELRQRVKSR